MPDDELSLIGGMLSETENATPVNAHDGSGTNINRAEAPNNHNDMTDEHYTEEGSFFNPAVPVSDKAGALGHSEPTSPFEIPDEAVGQSGTNDDDTASDSLSNASDSTPKPRKGWPKGKPRGGKNKTLPVAQPVEEKCPPPVVNVAPTPAPDPFAPENLKIRARNTGISVKKVLTTIPAKKKPEKQDFVRTRAGDEWQIETLIIEDKKNNNYYIVVPELHDHLLKTGFIAMLRLAVTRDGDLFVWVLKMPVTGAYYERWFQSALDGATLAETEWTQLESNRGGGCYDVGVATGIKAEPQWPDLTFSEILRLCFKDRYIDSLDHPFLKRLRGEI